MEILIFCIIIVRLGIQTLFLSLDCISELENSLTIALLYVKIRKTREIASRCLNLLFHVATFELKLRGKTSFKHRNTRNMHTFSPLLDSHSRSLKEGEPISVNLPTHPHSSKKDKEEFSIRRENPLNSSLKHFSANLSPPRWFPPTRKLVSFQHGQRKW